MEDETIMPGDASKDNDEAKLADAEDSSEPWSLVLKVIAVVLAAPVAVGLSYMTFDFHFTPHSIIVAALILSIFYSILFVRPAHEGTDHYYALRALFFLQQVFAILLIVMTPVILFFSCLGLLLLVVVSLIVFFVITRHYEDKWTGALIPFGLVMLTAVIWNYGLWHWLNSLD